MNKSSLDKILSNGSKSFQKLNHSTGDTRKIASLESSSGNAPLATSEVQKRTDGKFLIRITSVRSRLADEDGLCEKYLIDCCRYAHFIQDDSPQFLKIETTQRKKEKHEEEHTEILIYDSST